MGWTPVQPTSWFDACGILSISVRWVAILSRKNICIQLIMLLFRWVIDFMFF